MKITKQLAKILLDEIDEGKTHENFECVHDGAFKDNINALVNAIKYLQERN